MPSKSPAQHRLMEAAAHTKGGFGGVPQKVGKEFVKADQGKKFANGGIAKTLKKDGFYDNGTNKAERLKIINKDTTKPERMEIVDKVFSAKKMKQGGSAKQAATAIFMKEHHMKPKTMADGGGLYANIHAKQERIAHGSKEHMRKPGSKGAPTKDAFIQSAKTAKKKEGGSMKKSGGCEW
jgi:hypothetical protein